VTDLKSVPKK